MTGMYEQVQEAAQAVRKRCPSGRPRAGIILGTGLGGLEAEIEKEAVVPYRELPHFLESTAPSHTGQLLCGQFAGQSVVVMEGRFHAYEGYPLQRITFPVRVMHALGCDILIASNACGGLNPQFRRSDLMLIEDHINFMGDNPLIGKNDDRLGPRFPDMCFAYDRELLEVAERVALAEGIRAHKGVYAAVLGPNLETRAEYRMLRAVGADVVGMSTVPEVIVGVHCGLRCFGISVITDMCLADALQPVSLEEILAAAKEAEEPLRRFIRKFVAALPPRQVAAGSKS
ncbi:MAG TPA: purine-nucleoside phosphorylase [Gemmatales bacterium]|nr:purine-nucleoside phosphorylase [Gemmatales bacterium]HMP59353.1 purine-nucleoside phosphorylase [Gemmatales bacterium]